MFEKKLKDIEERNKNECAKISVKIKSLDHANADTEKGFQTKNYKQINEVVLELELLKIENKKKDLAI